MARSASIAGLVIGVVTIVSYVFVIVVWVVLLWSIFELGPAND